MHVFGKLVHIFGKFVHIFAWKLVSRPTKQVSSDLGPLWQPGVYNDTNSRMKNRHFDTRLFWYPFGCVQNTLGPAKTYKLGLSWGSAGSPTIKSVRGTGATKRGFVQLTGGRFLLQGPRFTLRSELSEELHKGKNKSDPLSDPGMRRKRAEYGFGEYGFKHRAQ